MWYIVEFTDTNPNELSTFAFAAAGLQGVIYGLEYFAEFHEFDSVILYAHPDNPNGV